MLIAESITGEKTDARNADRKNHYFCCCCKEEVVYKKGQVKLPHFAHKQNSLCSANFEGESWEHLKGKSDLYDWLCRIGFRPELEVYIEEINQRADVLFEWNSQLFAIEYQCSPIPEQSIINRTKGYLSLGIRPVWIAGEKLKLKKNLSISNRLFIVEWTDKSRFHLHYNTGAEKLTVSCMSVVNGKDNKQQVLCINKNETIIEQLFAIESASYQLADNRRVYQQRHYLHKMRHYNTMRFRPLFELMYETSLLIDHLPKVLFSEIAEEWTIITPPVEWKLRLLVFLNKQYADTIVTFDEIHAEFYCLVKKNQIKRYVLPNLTDNTFRILCYFLSALEQEKFILKNGEKSWKVNKVKYNW